MPPAAASAAPAPLSVVSRPPGAVRRCGRAGRGRTPACPKATPCTGTRAAAEAARVDGGRVAAVEAYGKNLFLDVHPHAGGLAGAHLGPDGPDGLARLDGLDGEKPVSIHVHLGLRGLFLRYDDPHATPRPGTRLRVASGRAAYDSWPRPGASCSTPRGAPASSRGWAPTRSAPTPTGPRPCAGCGAPAAASPRR
jgi:hypothetical protein